MWVEGEGWDPSFISVYLFIQTCWLFYRLGVFAHMERNLYFKKSISSEAKVAFYRHTVNLGRDDSDMQMSPYLWSDCKGSRLDQVAHEHLYCMHQSAAESSFITSIPAESSNTESRLQEVFPHSLQLSVWICVWNYWKTFRVTFYPTYRNESDWVHSKITTVLRLIPFQFWIQS